MAKRIEYPTPKANEVRIHFSPVIEGDFKRRGVFPELRLDAALYTLNFVIGYYHVDINRAAEMLGDAKLQHQSGTVRGLKKAYRHLAERIEQELDSVQRTVPLDESDSRGGDGPRPPAADDDEFGSDVDDDDDDDWPPPVRHNSAIKVGDGSRWHYLGSPDALLLEGVLDADNIPGNPACKYRRHSWGWHDGKLFIASRLGPNVAVTLLSKHAGPFKCCAPLNFRPR